MSANCSRRGFLHAAGGCFALSLIDAGLPASVLAAPVGEIEGRELVTGERTYPLPAADAVNIDRAAQVILVRSVNHVYAFSLACPHQHAAVKWVAKDLRFQCTKHDSRYQPDGAYTSGRATRNLDRFPIRRSGETVVVETSKVFESDKDAAGWAAASVAL
jgi:Rieske Fe-S protein